MTPASSDRRAVAAPLSRGNASPDAGARRRAIICIAALVGTILLASHSLPARGQNGPPGVVIEHVADEGHTNNISIAYIAPKNPSLTDLYQTLENRQVLERTQSILSALRLPEPLVIRTMECGMMNAWYAKENGAKTVTLCYELLQHILQTLPQQTSPAGVTATDAAAGQFFWLVLHEVGHGVFDMFAIPIWGREEDAADNFAAYIMLAFGKERARRLVGGAAWAWKGYIDRAKEDSKVQIPLEAFASNHGQPQERFYNLMCIAFGADPQMFSDLIETGYLPKRRAPNCQYEYKTLATAFQRNIRPHVDAQLAAQIMDTTWLPAPESMPAAVK
jgi:hypothetical protein